MPMISAQFEHLEGFTQSSAIRWCGPIQTCEVRSSATGSACIAEWVRMDQVSPELFALIAHQWRANAIRQPGRSLRQIALRVEDRSLHRVIDSPRGRPLKDWMFQQTYDLNQSLCIAISLTKCLAAYHRASRLFVWFSDECLFLDHRNRVQLRDSPLGSVHTNQDLLIQPISDMIYLSPESSGSLSREMKPASDLYAVGAILFGLLTGRPPIRAENASEYLTQQLCVEAPRLRELRFDVPKAVDDLVARLLRRDSYDRYQTAGALLYDLKELLAIHQGKSKQRSFVIGTRDVRSTLVETGLVGFDEQLATIQRSLNDARSGPSQVQIICASDANCRKAILDEVELRAKASQLSVFRGAATTGNNPKPLQSLEPVILTIVDLMQADETLAIAVAAATQPHASTLAQLLPQLAHLWPASEQRNGPEVYGGQRAAVAIEEVIAAIASQKHGMAILFDDIDRADELTRNVISSLAYGIEHGKISYLVCLIAGRATHLLPFVPHTPVITTGRMADQCVAMHLRSTAGRLSEAIEQTVISAAEGNPWMASAILGRMIDTQAISPSKNGWIANGSLLEALRGDQTIGELLNRQVKALPSSSLDCLCTAAAIGRSFDLAMLSHLTQIKYSDALKIVTDALGRRLLWRENRPGVFRFAHEQVQQQLYAHLTPDGRRSIHLAAAAYLQIHAPSNIYDLAYHFDAAEHGELALDYSLEAARTARQCFSIAVAKEQLNIAKRWLSLGTPQNAFNVYADLGEIHLLAGQYELAANHLNQAMELAQTPYGKARVLQQIGELAFKRGSFVEAADQYEKALATLGMRVPKNRLSMLVGVALQGLIQVGHTFAHQRWVARKGDLTEVDCLRLQLLSRLSHVYWFSRHRLWTLGNHLRSLNEAERFNPSATLATVYSEHGPVMSLLRWFRRANRYAHWSLDLRRERADLWGQGQSYHYLGVVQLAQCRFQEAITNASSAVDLFRQTGDFWEMNMARYQVANALFRIGRLSEAIAVASQMFYSGREIGDLQATGISLDVWARAEPESLPLSLVADEAKRLRPDAQSNAQTQLAYAVCLLHHGQIDAAIDTLQSAIDRCKQAGHLNTYISPCYAWMATATRRRLESTQCSDVKLLRERFSQARVAVRNAVKISRRFPADQAHCLRELAFHSMMVGKLREAEKTLHKSLASAQRCIQPIEEYDTLLALDALTQRTDSPTQTISPALQARLRELTELYRKELKTTDKASKERQITNVSLADRFVTVLQAGRKITKALTPESVYMEASEAAKRLLRGKYVDTLKVIHRDGEVFLEPLLADPADRTRDARIAANEKLIRAVIDRGHAVCRDDSIAAFQSPAKSIIATPVAFRGECVAVILISHDELKGLFGKDEIRIADFISTLAGAALENADGFASLQSMNDTLEHRVRERTQAAEDRARQLAQSNVQLRETEEQLREAIAVANSANQAKSRFLATISHEIRTPLNGILGMTHLAKQASDDVRCSNYLDIVEESGQSLLTLINDLLDFSKLEAGKMEFERIAFNVVELIGEVVRLMSPSAMQNGVDMCHDLSHPVPRLIYGDPSRLRQVIVNLVGNAIKFTSQGSITLSARVCDGSSGPTLSISVKDTGIGIPASKHAKVFESFSQCDSSTTRKYGGTGLGLAICQELTELMGGTIGLVSELGVGSTFTVNLPLEIVDESMLEGSVSQLLCARNNEDALTAELMRTEIAIWRHRILVAEDGEINQEVIRGILEMQGCDVTIAEDGRQALELASHQHFDLCFMDIDMPNMDGIEATIQIRSGESGKGDRPLPIVAMTAHSGEQIWDVCQAAGMNDYLAKPIQPEALMQSITRHVRLQTLFEQTVKDDH